MAHGYKTGGRQKGTPNKTTMAVKDVLTETFDRLGGVEAMTRWARDNETDFYRLYARLLPREVKADVNCRDDLGERLEAAAKRVERMRMEREREEAEAAALPSRMTGESESDN